MVLEDCDSEFRLLASICRDAEIYQGVSDSRATPRLAQIMDRFAENNGFAPGLFKLSDRQQRRAVNQISSLLLKRFNGDWSLTEQVVMGNLELADLSAQKELVPLRCNIACALRGEDSSIRELRGQNADA